MVTFSHFGHLVSRRSTWYFDNRRSFRIRRDWVTHHLFSIFHKVHYGCSDSSNGISFDLDSQFRFEKFPIREYWFWLWITRVCSFGNLTNYSEIDNYRTEITLDYEDSRRRNS